MKVTTKVQSLLTLDGSEISGPVDIAWYTGDSLPDAMAAVATAMSASHRSDAYTETISILVEF